ncbi:DEAD-domain-containing protein [Viridothelium virens]|uniref:RNA helicase n=1 Tax=Viridothelium virens TaxID=1048519 RepID=A0A6A6GW71_VIRVR|nr:DEAD-domain-containing protein [Viridothelium virens]
MSKHSKKHKREAQEAAISASRENDQERKDSPTTHNTGEGEVSHGTKHQKVLAKFQKSMESQARGETQKQTAILDDHQNEGDVELHGLEPLPQPEPVTEPEFIPTFTSLPSWISNPITVSSSAKKAFTEMSLDEKTVATLSQRGYTEALAIQSAVIPMLLGPAHLRHSDLCVAASTGSGKTLAYILPMVEDLRSRPIRKLRSLIIVPTRELVSQVSKVAEQCISGTHLKIGTAVGAVPLLNEQEALIERGRQFDPEGWKSLQDKAQRRLLYGDVDVQEDVRMLEDAVRMLPDHVPVYSSTVDLLICTPGRLIDHIQSTNGFSLDDLEWLVVDEADRLLDESFQQWVDVIMATLETSRPTARNRLLAELWLPPEKRNIQKVILSATMTRDISKLGSLRLRRPKLVVVEGVQTTNVSDNSASTVGDRGNELPTTLRELAIPVGDGLEKPLYLLRLLRSDVFVAEKVTEVEDFPRQFEEDASSGPTNETDSLSELGPTTPDSASSAEPYGEPSTEEMDKLAVPAVDVGFDIFNKDSHVPPPQKCTDDIHPGTAANVLIFTNSNENATRLSHLIGILHPPYAGLTGVLTKSSTSSTGKTVLGAFRRGKTSILIASDRASRGLDLPHLSHVVNYDMPRSVTAYIHRVGRTARAGRPGTAWTLFTSTEARWFWNAIARTPEVIRQRPVQRKRLDAVVISAKQKEEYEEALGELQRAVHGDQS